MAQIALHDLLERLALDADALGVDADNPFPFRLHSNLAARIQPGNPKDPILRQVLPLKIERQPVEGFTADPVGDLAARPAPGVLHKYHGRALVMRTPRCDLHCRFCFRRHFPYEENIGQAAWQQTLDYLRTHADIHEVILSGGDPLTLSEAALLETCQALEALPHVHTLRIHTRTPIAAPSRMPKHDWLTWARRSRLKLVLVSHCNHPQELSEQTAAVFQTLRKTGVTLLNQSVLLRGVNDTGTTLEQLSHALFQQGVLPYYLHQLDPVAGAAHFAVDDATARGLIDYLRRRLPGYLVPRLVREIPGEASKTPVEAP
ncbi:L-lysine 2,3-aminomutase [Sulfurivirga caldicuralii]|uniref:L-lysine 2,3-aminomutase n=1 Tax=Sulfurivirga caldicuralii TaxID=364032 RepID=A0A1N6DS19_9GAMM|nr:EF-P beta-lysylation protein EpmB [Sulfurivirga caldicuralii]SIN73582.1 L-lysine 2,3-aminomutase [Sulfurivirga caldicuralii]